VESPEADASSSPNNYNASLRREGCSHWLACCSLFRWLRRSRANFEVPWLNSARTSICGTGFSKESVYSSFRWASRCCRRVVKVVEILPCYAMNARIRFCMSSNILGRGVSPALFCASVVCVDIVEVWLHQLKNCAGSATGVKMWGKINPQGGRGNESSWLISLYSLICSRCCWFLQRSQYRNKESVWERDRKTEYFKAVLYGLIKIHLLSFECD